MNFFTSNNSCQMHVKMTRIPINFCVLPIHLGLFFLFSLHCAYNANDIQCLIEAIFLSKALHRTLNFVLLFPKPILTQILAKLMSNVLYLFVNDIGNWLTIDRNMYKPIISK